MQSSAIIQGSIPFFENDDDSTRIDKRINKHMKENNVFMCLPPKLFDKDGWFCSISLFFEEYLISTVYDQKVIAIHGNVPVSGKDDDPDRIDRKITRYIQENNARAIFPNLYIYKSCGSCVALLFLENNPKE
jgi:hypothetical protein